MRQVDNATAAVDGSRRGCQVVHTSLFERPSNHTTKYDDYDADGRMVSVHLPGRAMVLTGASQPVPMHTIFARTATYWMRTHWPAPKLNFFVKKNRRTWLPPHHILYFDNLMQMHTLICIVQTCELCDPLPHNANLSALLRLKIGMPAVLLHDHDLSIISNTSPSMTLMTSRGPELHAKSQIRAARHPNHIKSVSEHSWACPCTRPGPRPQVRRISSTCDETLAAIRDGTGFTMSRV